MPTSRIRCIRVLEWSQKKLFCKLLGSFSFELRGITRILALFFDLFETSINSSPATIVDGTTKYFSHSILLLSLFMTYKWIQ